MRKSRLKRNRKEKRRNRDDLANNQRRKERWITNSKMRK